MARRSRLSKNFQRKSRNTLILSILAIAAILFLLLRYGIPLISDASFIFGRVTSSSDNNKRTPNDENFVPIPSLDSLPTTTKEQNLKVTGTSLAGLTIEIYLSGSKAQETEVDDDGNFEAEIELSEGENIIKAKAVKEDKESDFSDSSVVTYKKKAPELSIESPSDGAQINGGNPIEVKGKTDPDSSVVVNDFQAIINSNGDWSYFLTLKGGDNEIKVISTDTAGNKTEKTIHVNYSQ